LHSLSLTNNRGVPTAYSKEVLGRYFRDLEKEDKRADKLFSEKYLKRHDQGTIASQTVDIRSDIIAVICELEDSALDAYRKGRLKEAEALTDTLYKAYSSGEIQRCRSTYLLAVSKLYCEAYRKALSPDNKEAQNFYREEATKLREALDYYIIPDDPRTKHMNPAVWEEIRNMFYSLAEELTDKGIYSGHIQTLAENAKPYDISKQESRENIVDDEILDSIKNNLTKKPTDKTIKQVLSRMIQHLSAGGMIPGTEIFARTGNLPHTTVSRIFSAAQKAGYIEKSPSQTGKHRIRRHTNKHPLFIPTQNIEKTPTINMGTTREIRKQLTATATPKTKNANIHTIRRRTQNTRPTRNRTKRKATPTQSLKDSPQRSAAMSEYPPKA